LPGKSGDPSPVTAFGVYMGMKAAAKIQFGSDDLSGKTIAVQGVGHVGEYLVAHLAKENANVFITDINQEALKRIGLKPDKKIKLYNGDLECSYRKFSIFDGFKKDQFSKIENTIVR
jgi:leucine dehydrogenase